VHFHKIWCPKIPFKILLIENTALKMLVKSTRGCGKVVIFFCITNQISYFMIRLTKKVICSARCVGTCREFHMKIFLFNKREKKLNLDIVKILAFQWFSTLKCARNTFIEKNTTSTGFPRCSRGGGYVPNIFQITNTKSDI